MNYTITHAKNKSELHAVLDFTEGIFGQGEQFDRAIWEARLHLHPELIVFAQINGQVVGIAPSFLEDNGNVTVGAIAVDRRYRMKGIASALMVEVERQSKAIGARMVALGANEAAEDFYQKLGYIGQLLIQSEKCTADEMLALNPGYPVAFTNVYDGKIHQLCLRLDMPDRELQQRYESSLEGCYTQTMFWKNIA